MSTIEQLTLKIGNNGQQKAAEIIAEANKKAEGINQARVSEAEKVKEEIIRKAHIDAESIGQHTLSSKTIEQRDSMLSIKQEIIKKVYAKALEKLSNMSVKDFASYLTRTLSTMKSIQSGKVVVPSKYKDIDWNEVSSMSGVSVSLAEGRTVENGFLLLVDGVEYNNTFESLIGYSADELEIMISTKLF